MTRAVWLEIKDEGKFSDGKAILKLGAPQRGEQTIFSALIDGTQRAKATSVYDLLRFGTLPWQFFLLRALPSCSVVRIEYETRIQAEKKSLMFHDDDDAVMMNSFVQSPFLLFAFNIFLVKTFLVSLSHVELGEKLYFPKRFHPR